MTPKAMGGLFLAYLMAIPVVPAYAFPTPPSREAALGRLVSDAFHAGVAASDVVFAVGGERSTDETERVQSNRELRTICLADCERELQKCQSDVRAGVHTQNCSAIMDACTDVCWARWPAPPPEPENDNSQLWYWFGVIVGGVLVAWALYEPEEDDYTYLTGNLRP